MFKFLGVGAQKSGTTWLYTALSRHPLINFPQGKEVHFWNNDISDEKIDNYLSGFLTPSLIEGEITPAYGHLTPNQIEHIYEHLPDIKIIYVMRNPVERAWSAALMALGRSEMVFNEASDQWFIDHFTSAGSLSRGDYQQSLMNWVNVYSAENVLPLIFEDMVLDPEKSIKKTLEHLELGAPDVEMMTDWGLERKIFSGSGDKIRPQLSFFLKSIYREKIINLENYLKMDLSLEWGGWWNE
uniref:Sulfotransferase n=1 Tax=uncultured Thiotrichaceae bacterium TaxID=298394 RepID=A0A6S6UMZ0_9GAMM|nr:MAG: Sulfotransferase [uncultured Thiotrichaceae bacterium]